MAQFTYTMDDSQLNILAEAFAWKYGYAGEILEDGELIPNPQSKLDFALSTMVNLNIKGVMKSYLSYLTEVRLAAEKAQALQLIDSVEVTLQQQP